MFSKQNKTKQKSWESWHLIIIIIITILLLLSLILFFSSLCVWIIIAVVVVEFLTILFIHWFLNVFSISWSFFSIWISFEWTVFFLHFRKNVHFQFQFQCMKSFHFIYSFKLTMKWNSQCYTSFFLIDWLIEKHNDWINGSGLSFYFRSIIITNQIYFCVKKRKCKWQFLCQYCSNIDI